jgi:phosphoenolpyruvate carboxylase
VRSLGVLVVEVLREQAGLPLYEVVEDLRRTAIARREADTNSTDAHAALTTSASRGAVRDVSRIQK